MNTTAPEPTNTGPGPLAAAWRWSVRRSPILNIFRWADHRLHPQRLAADRLAVSGLPEPVCARIAETVRRTRLHATERDQLCRELITHCEDALPAPAPHGSNPTAESVRAAESLGDPKAAAPLIRRAMKRKRSVVSQARMWLIRATGWGVTAMVLLYVGLFIRFQIGTPSIKTDYLALINAPILATPSQDRAISVYREVAEAWKPVRDGLGSLPPLTDVPDGTGANYSSRAVDDLPRLDPTHPQYRVVRSAILAFRPELDRLHEASRRPIMGYLYTTGATEADGTPITDPAHPEMDGALYALLLPHLNEMRRLTRLLAADARLAALDGDAARATENLAAIANTARLLTSDPTLIGDLVSLAIHNLATSETNSLLADHPDLLSAVQLLTLTHTLAASGNAANTTDLRGETYTFEDILQRSFTDNGNGDGRLTPWGLTTLMGLEDDALIQPGTPANAMSKITGPLSMELLAGRAELSALYREHIDAARKALAEGPESLPQLFELEYELESMGPIEEARVLPVSLILPAISRAVEKFMISRTQTDATLTALAAEHHRRVHGEYPAGLDELVPSELPSLPFDPFDPGKPLKYRLTESGPMLYVVGADGDDDGGTGPDLTLATARPNRLETYKKLRYRYPFVRPNRNPAVFDRLTPDGDWILFPPQSD